MKESPPHVIDFKKERQFKQSQYDRVYQSLQERVSFFAERMLNVREKVRAKHIFHHLTGATAQQVEVSPWDAHFAAWLAYEYLNIQGKRVLERFLETERDRLDEEEWFVAGRLLVSYPSLYELQPRDGGIRDLWTDAVVDHGKHIEEWKNGRLLFARWVRIGYEWRLHGPVARFDEESKERALNDLEQRHQRFHDRFPDGSSRIFLQQQGVAALRHAVERM